MAEMTLAELAEQMRDIDFAMLSTRTGDGAIAGRPMSNNRDVDYAGNSFLFSDEKAHLVADIERDPQVGLSFVGAKGLFGKPPLFIAVEGVATLIRDRAAFAAHWTKELDRWFDQGIDTPGIVLIHVRARRMHYWDGTHDGELTL